ncbi:MAG: hypothetical protein KH347_01735 [Acetobacter sp.]|nr:hypothetical protein [Acetobacter sp.]
MINPRDFFWRLKIGVLSRAASIKAKIVRFANGMRHFSIRQSLHAFVPAAKLFFKETPLTLTMWTAKAKNGGLRLFLLFALLSLIFGLTAKSLYFIANDGFVSFRYVAQAVDGHGFVWNPPPFEPVNGYTGILWLLCLRVLWFLGILPPFSANLLSFCFSMGIVALGFLFLRRMPMPSALQTKSLLFFLIYCTVLLTNRTFLMFFWSGTEAALFNFLVIGWVYLATDKTKHPVRLALLAVLLSLTRWDGALFLPFTLILDLISFRQAKAKSVFGILLLGLPLFYVNWMQKKYGTFPPTVFSAYYKEPFPFGLDYAISFAVEYALWFWLIFVFAWAAFKMMRHKKAELSLPFLLAFFFAVYIAAYSVLSGADILSYRPLSFFIPLITLGALRIITENITKRLRTVAVIFAVYLLLASAIPVAYGNSVKDLTTRKQTAFLYKPIPPEKQHFYTFFADVWNKAQKRLIYQGAALRHKEHQVLFTELTKSLPSREEGKLLKAEYRRLLAWDFAGQIAWTFPYVYILDTSGQNDLFVTLADFKYDNRRVLGHEKNVPVGYAGCFGGNSIMITPFDGTPDVTYMPSLFPLTDSVIKGCEKLWRYQGELAKFKRNPQIRDIKR